MLNFYNIVKENLSFNRFAFKETICLEYTCPIDAEQIGIFSRNDYLVYVLSGKKTYKTFNAEWTLGPGQSLYLKKTRKATPTPCRGSLLYRSSYASNSWAISFLSEQR